MPRSTPLTALVLASSFAASSCGGFTALYPARPAETPGEPIADPTPAKVVLHTTITSAGLKTALEQSLPQTGEGTFPFVGGDRKFTWTRTPASLRFGQGRVGIELHVDAVADMPVSHLDLGLDFKILA